MNFNMSTTTSTINCADVNNFYDDGGSAGNHSTTINITHVFKPATTGKYLQVTFNSFSLGWNNGSKYFYLEIYDGSSINSKLLYRFCSNYCTDPSSLPITVSATNAEGALTFYFNKVASPTNTSTGWAAVISCIDPTNSTWNGATSTNWNTASNWTPNIVPDQRTNVTIPSGPSNQPFIQDAYNAYCRNLTIENGASLTYSIAGSSSYAFTIFGNITVNGAFQRSGSSLQFVSICGGTSSDYATISGTGNMSYVPLKVGIRDVSSNPLFSGYYKLMNNQTIRGLSTTLGAFDMNDYNLTLLHCRIQDADFFQKSGTLSIEGFYDGTTSGQVYINDTYFNEGTGTTYFSAKTYNDWTSLTGNQVVQSGVTFYNLKVRANNGYTCEIGTGTTTNVTVTNNFEIINPSTTQSTGSWVRTNFASGGRLIIGNNCNVNSSGTGGIRLVLLEPIRRNTLGTGFTSSNPLDTIIIYHYTTTTNTAIQNYGNSITFSGTVRYDNSACPTSTVKQIILGTNYNNLEITGNTIPGGLSTCYRELSSNTCINGNLSTDFISSYSCLDATTNNYNLTLNGHWIHKTSTRPFLPRNGTVTFGGTGTQWINTWKIPDDWPNTYPPSNAIAFYFWNLIIDGTDVMYAVNNDYGSYVDNDLTINSGKKLSLICSSGGSNKAFLTYGNFINNGNLNCEYNSYYFTMRNYSSPGPNTISGSGTFTFVGINAKGNITQTSNLNSFHSLLIDATYTYSVNSGLNINFDKYISYQANFTNNGTFTLNNNCTLTTSGHWTNNSTFNSNQSTVIFNGNVQQNIKTNCTSSIGSGNSFYNLTINNSSSTGLNISTANNHLALDNNLTFTDGHIISASDKLVIFKSTSSYNSASDISNISGPVRKIGNSTFTFPTGKNSSFHPIGISAPSNATDHFTAEYFWANPQTAYGTAKDASIDHLSKLEYWILDRTNGISNVSVTLSWDTASVVSSGYIDDLIVTRWNGTQWNDHGNSCSSSCPGTINDGNLTTSSTVSSFSPFTLASKSAFNPLPIDLLKFEALKKSNYNHIFWVTVNEINSDYYILEKSSDMKQWSFLDKINSKNNESENYYESYDYSPYKSTNYYKLTQFDRDLNSKSYYLTIFNKNITDFCKYIFEERKIIFDFEVIGNNHKYFIINSLGSIIESEIVKVPTIEMSNNKYRSGLYYLYIYNSSNELIDKEIITIY